MDATADYVVFLSDGSIVAHTIDQFGECLREVILPANSGCEGGDEPMVLVALFCPTSSGLH